jgi:hypothetical protein
LYHINYGHKFLISPTDLWELEDIKTFDGLFNKRKGIIMPKTEKSNCVIKIKEKNGKIWSNLRKKWLVKTPEEIVRQNYLT